MKLHTWIALNIVYCTKIFWMHTIYLKFLLRCFFDGTIEWFCELWFSSFEPKLQFSKYELNIIQCLLCIIKRFAPLLKHLHFRLESLNTFKRNLHIILFHPKSNPIWKEISNMCVVHFIKCLNCRSFINDIEWNWIVISTMIELGQFKAHIHTTMPKISKCLTYIERIINL